MLSALEMPSPAQSDVAVEPTIKALVTEMVEVHRLADSVQHLRSLRDSLVASVLDASSASHTVFADLVSQLTKPLEGARLFDQIDSKQQLVVLKILLKLARTLFKQLTSQSPAHHLAIAGDVSALLERLTGDSSRACMLLNEIPYSVKNVLSMLEDASAASRALVNDDEKFVLDWTKKQQRCIDSRPLIATLVHMSRHETSAAYRANWTKCNARERLVALTGLFKQTSRFAKWHLFLCVENLSSDAWRPMMRTDDTKDDAYMVNSNEDDLTTLNKVLATHL